MEGSRCRGRPDLSRDFRVEPARVAGAAAQAGVFACGAGSQPRPHLCQQHLAVLGHLHNTSTTHLCSRVLPEGAEAGPVSAPCQPRGGDGPPLPHPSTIPRCQAAPGLLPGPLSCLPGCTPLFTQLIPGICHPERRTGGAALGLEFGEGREAGGERRGWERHRHQSAGSKQSWRRETTTSCQALLKTRRAQKGKEERQKDWGGGKAGGSRGGTMERWG